MKQAYFTHRFPAAQWARIKRASGREGGISLIEVLVAIALLTIGVLSVITLFPAGFLTLEIAANATNADRIGQRELEKLNSLNAGQIGIIESIYSNYDAALDTMPNSCQSPAAYNPPSSAGSEPCAAPTLTPPNASANAPIYLGLNNDINAYRLIKGETVRVPPALIAPGGTVATLSLYTPAFAPVVSPNATASTTQAPSVFAVHGLPWSRRAVSSNGATTAVLYPDPSALLSTTTLQIPNYPLASPVVYSTALVAAPQYLIDYTNGKIALPSASYPQIVLFRFTDGTAPNPVTYHVSITVPAGNSNEWIDPFNTPGVTVTALPESPAVPNLPAEPVLPWKTGSDVLSRDFTCLNPMSAAYNPANFTADPYQFQTYLADQSGTTPLANLGVIAFNPLGSAIKDTNGRPLMASVDYEVYDWHIISEDRTATSTSGAATAAIRLSLNSLYSKSANDTFSDNTKYTGLYYNTPSVTAANNLDVTVLDLQKGIVLTQSTPTAANDYSVDYPDGVVNITNVNEVNVPLRVFYRAREDWGVALSKAPSNYVLTDYTANSATPAYGECQLDAANQKLYFPRADIGKTVNISGLTGTVGTGTPPPALPNIDLLLQTLKKDPNANRCFVDLTTANSLGIGSPFPGGTTLYTVAAGQTGTVQGATIQAQVIWKEQGIWKHREITSVIPAGATQMAVQQ